MPGTKEQIGNIVHGTDFNKDRTGSVRRFCHSSYCDLSSDEVKDGKAEPQAVPGRDGLAAACEAAVDRGASAAGAPPSRPLGRPPLPSGPDAEGSQ